MKKTLIAACLAAAMLAPIAASAENVIDSGMLNATMFGASYRPTTETIDNKIMRGDAIAADTLLGAVALGGEVGSADSTDAKTMIGGASVLAFSNPVSGIGAGSSGYDQIACVETATPVSSKPEVGWRNSYSA